MSEVYALDRLGEIFARTECLHVDWARAGGILAEMGVTTVTSGVCGEVMGGHYTVVNFQPGAKRATALLSELVPGRGAGPVGAPTDFPFLETLLRRRHMRSPLGIRPELWRGLPDVEAQMEGGVQADLLRLQQRGVEGTAKLTEAYVTEHRGSQYVAKQPLSYRGETDVSMPFADRALLNYATALSPSAKLLNSLNREMLRKHAPEPCSHSTAATLVPASWPIAAQETSRFTRRLYEHGRWRLNSLTRGVVPHPQFGWWEYGFLRDGTVLNAMLDDLRADLWDKAAVRSRIAANTNRTGANAWRSETSLLAQQLVRMTSIDLMLR